MVLTIDFPYLCHNETAGTVSYSISRQSGTASVSFPCMCVYVCTCKTLIINVGYVREMAKERYKTLSG